MMRGRNSPDTELGLHLRAASCFSGIGAPELGGPQFEWVWCAEVEKFPSAVLAHRFPHSTNLGDVTAEDFLQRASAFGRLDLLVGGPPCQDFSVAGLRAGVAGNRGNLSLRFMEIAHAIRPRNLLVENVPGWLNMPDNAFGCFLGALVGADDALRSPLDGKWPSAGMVAGPRARAAWRVFDAQYFGVAQRRRRVFVVADFGEGADPAAVLFERQGVRGNTPPRREAGQGTAGTISARTQGGGGLGTDFELGGGLVAADRHELGEDRLSLREMRGAEQSGMVADVRMVQSRPAGDSVEVVGALNTANGKTRPGDTLQCAMSGHMLAFGGNNCSGPVEVSPSLLAHAGPAGRMDFASETFVTAAVPFDTTQITSKSNYSQPKEGDPCHPLAAGAHPPAIAFSSKDYGNDATDDLSPTLRSMGHDKSHANGGGQMAIAWSIMPQNSGKDFKARAVDVAQPVMAAGPVGGNQGGDYTQQEWQVRRLTPTECHRLQALPDDHCAIEYRGKIAADGPQYKALGNSWAASNGAWIIGRIAERLAA